MRFKFDRYDLKFFGLLYGVPIALMVLAGIANEFVDRGLAILIATGAFIYFMGYVIQLAKVLAETPKDERPNK